jgi:hypothetical protein
MAELLVMLIVPPSVGLITYIMVRFVQDRDENRDIEIVERHEPSEEYLPRT